MIVIEGVDNSGKSTLIRNLVHSVFPGAPVQVSEGPPKHPGEMNERVIRYSRLPHRTLFDRHPCVSQPIYGSMATHVDKIDDSLINDFYGRAPLFIYCDPLDRGMSGHAIRAEVDTPEHLENVNRFYTGLLLQYREWAIRHANIVYRIGDDIPRVLRMVETLGR